MIESQHLVKKDWHRLIKFLACLAVRTPASYLKHQQLIKGAFDNTFGKPYTGNSAFKQKTIEDPSPSKFSTLIQDLDKLVKVEVDTKNKQIISSLQIGQDSWVAVIKHILVHTYKVLLGHKWSIVSIDDDILLPTSDNPVIFLNFTSYKNYDLNSGWGLKNGNIILPLTPNKIIFTEIGSSIKSRSQFNSEKSQFVKKIILENSYRYVFSKYKVKNMYRDCPIEVNPKKYKAEKNAWSTWKSAAPV